jgi:hypothetical protein
MITEWRQFESYINSTLWVKSGSNVQKYTFRGSVIHYHFEDDYTRVVQNVRTVLKL